MSINLHIERLILDGLSEGHVQGSLIGAAVETELARLLADGGMELSLQSAEALPSVPGSVIQLAPSKPAQLGRQIARAVYQGIGQKQVATLRSAEGSGYVR